MKIRTRFTRNTCMVILVVLAACSADRVTAQNWTEDFESYPIRDSSYKFGYSWQATTIQSGGLAITGRSMASSPLNNPASPGIFTTGYFRMSNTAYNISFQGKVTNLSSAPVLSVRLVDINGVEVVTLYNYTFTNSGVNNLNFSFAGLNGWYRLRFIFSGSGGGSRGILDNIISDIPAGPSPGKSTRLSDIQTQVTITASDCNSQTVTVRFTNLGPDAAFTYGNMGVATLQSLTGINYSNYTTSPGLQLDPLTNTLYFFPTFSTTGLPSGQYLELIINLNTPNNCTVSLGATFQGYNLQTDHIPINNTDYKDISFTVLPAKLSPLQIETEGEVNRLRWTAYNETLVSHYEVEKSADGRVFYTVSTVPAKGNGQSYARYQFDDHTGAEKTYYRITTVDIDGRKESGNVVSVGDKNNITGMHAYPNPVRRNGSLTIQSPVAGRVDVCLTESSGRILYRGVLQTGSQRRVEFRLPQHLSGGLYWISIAQDNRVLGTKTLMVLE